MLMIVAVTSRLPQLLELQQERTWQPLEARELGDVTVGIVGLGSTGRAVGALATAFGCRVIATRRREGVGGGERPRSPRRQDGADDDPIGPGRVDSAAATGRPAGAPRRGADFVVLAAPLTDGDARPHRASVHWALMRRGAVVINVARGELDRRAGAAPGARRTGRSAVPCWTRSPRSRCRPASPLYDLGERDPHPAHRVVQRRACSTARVDLFCDNLRRYAAGQPLVNVVDADAGY